MKRAFIFCILASVLISGCGLLEELQGTTSEASDQAPAPNADIPAIASELLFADSDCLLPCFAGLYPGESSVEAIEAFVSQFDVDNEAVRLHQFERAYSLSLFPEPGGLLLLGFVIEDDKLSYTTVGISSVHDWLSQIPYDLPDLFSTYGEPDDVFILIAGPPTWFTLILPYNEQGFMLRYSATYDDRELASNNEPLPICLNQEVVDLEQIDLWLQNPGELELVESHQPDLREDREYRPWWSIQRMASVTVAQFTDFFVSNPQGCFLIPSLTELREQGYVP